MKFDPEPSVLSALDMRASTLEQVVENLPVGVVIHTADTSIVYANQTAQQLLGMSRQDILGLDTASPGWQFVNNEKRSMSVEEFPVSRVLKTREPVRNELMGLLQPNTDDVCWLLINADPLLDEHEQIKGVIVTGQDVSIYRRVAEQLLVNETAHGHMQKMETVGRMAGGLAHEFNNKLMGISGCLEACRDEVGPDHAAVEWVNQALEEVCYSAGLIDQLLAFSSKQRISPCLMDMNEIIETCLTELQSRLPSGASMRWNPSPNRLNVSIDSRQLKNMINELVSNAVDAIGESGRIILETCKASFTLHDTAIAVDRPGDYAVLTVSDDGKGMDQKTQEKVFEPFFTTKEFGTGVGMGLSKVYGIVMQNQGRVVVYSEPNQGSSMKVYLPLAAESTSARKEGDPQKYPSGSETILLVEDEQNIRFLAQKFLHKLGYKVVTAEDAEQALKMVEGKEKSIDMLLCDIVLPGMIGPELVKRLQGKNPKLGCLIISGYSRQILNERNLIDPELAYLEKPFTKQALARSVRRVLDEEAVR